MNTLHHWICSSLFWRKSLQGRIVPWALDGLDLGAHVLELGPGYGFATGLLLRRTSSVVGVEVDGRLAVPLRQRLSGSHGSVIQGDATELPFRNDSFSSAVCFTMLHHIPSTELQNRLLAEVLRVVQPGGLFAGSDSLGGRGMNWLHRGDTLLTVDPDTFPERLRRSGFETIDVGTQKRVMRFRARRPVAVSNVQG